MSEFQKDFHRVYVPACLLLGGILAIITWIVRGAL